MTIKKNGYRGVDIENGRTTYIFSMSSEEARLVAFLLTGVLQSDMGEPFKSAEVGDGLLERIQGTLLPPLHTEPWLDDAIKKSNGLAFGAGVRTALHLLALHDEETIYRELLDLMEPLGSFLIECIEENSTEFSGLEKYNIVRKVAQYNDGFGWIAFWGVPDEDDSERFVPIQNSKPLRGDITNPSSIHWKNTPELELPSGVNRWLEATKEEIHQHGFFIQEQNMEKQELL